MPLADGGPPAPPPRRRPSTRRINLAARCRDALVVAALVLYSVVPLPVRDHDPLGVGLAAVPLFFAAAFLPAARPRSSASGPSC